MNGHAQQQGCYPLESNMKNCLSCEWFHPLKQEDLADRDIYIGTCSRWPPQHEAPGHLNPTGLPFVRSPSYCGEYQQKTP